MNRAFGFVLIGLISCFSAKAFAAEEAALAKPGKELAADNFARDDMKPKWRVGKGSWAVKDGVVTVAENPDDKHGAYAYIQPSFVFKDIVCEFSVKLDGARAV